MSAGIRSDAGGTFAALQFNGADSVLFDANGLRSAPNKSVAATSGPGNTQLAFRNLCFNGDMEIWQAGELFNNLSSYGPDGFFVGFGVGASNVVARNALNFDTILDGAQARYSCDVTHTTGGGADTFGNFKHPIEDVTRTAAREVTVSFWIFCGLAGVGKKIAIEFAQYFGTGGSPSAEVNSLGVAQFTLAEGWQKIKHSFTFPNIVGKTLGTDNNHYSYAMVWFDAGSTFNGRTLSLGPQSLSFSITRWQVEFGSIATPFEFRPKGVDLAIARRYYSTSLGFADNLTLLSFNATAATQAQYRSVDFQAVMRATPTIVLSAGSTQNVSSVLINSACPFGFSWQALAAGAGYGYAAIFYTANARL